MSHRYQQVLERERRWKGLLTRWITGYQFSNDFYEESVKGHLSQGVRWVDLGCGKNALMEELKEFGAQGIGLDREIHPERTRHPSVSMIRADIAFLPFKDGSLDLASNNVLMEHLPDPLSAVREVHRCLKPGGFLIFRTPNALHPLNLLLRWVPDKWKKRLIQRIFGVDSRDVFPTFYRANRMHTLRRLCISAGFNDVRVRAFEDVHTAFGFFFFISLLYYLVVRFRPLAFLRTNFVVTAKK
jgi:SAM-dependent methyltransferase